MINALHDKLLFLTQGYISAFLADGMDPSIALKALNLCLRVFYYMICQDIHPSVEDNLASWVSTLREVLCPAFSQQAKKGEERFPKCALSDLAFKCKGEGIRVVSLLSTKYTEDFEQHIRQFAEVIWQAVSNGD